MWPTHLAALGRGLLELGFPARCAACHDRVPAGTALCATCAASLEPVDPAGCPVCGLPGAPAGGRCGRCAAAPPPFAAARAPFLYGGQLAVAIGRFKFGGAPELARPLGGLLAPALGAALDASCTPPAAPPLLVPVPLHPRRLRRREFNQALLLVRAARAALGGRRAPLDPFALRRVRDTRPQVDLGAGARVANVAGAFVAAPARVAGRSVVLVDDVLTTGATAAECARALGRAGAARVEVLTLARAVP